MSSDLDIPDLREFLLAFARRRWPGLDSLHDDLVGDSLRDFVASYRVDPDRPASAEDQARAQAATILRRRVVDHFRKPVAEFARLDVADSLPDPLGLTEDAILHRRALRLTLAYLTDRDESERELLLDRVPGPLSAAQRKRRQRLRAELRERIDAALGPDASSLFDGDT